MANITTSELIVELEQDIAAIPSTDGVADWTRPQVWYGLVLTQALEQLGNPYGNDPAGTTPEAVVNILREAALESSLQVRTGGATGVDAEIASARRRGTWAALYRVAMLVGIPALDDQYQCRPCEGITKAGNHCGNVIGYLGTRAGEHYCWRHKGHEGARANEIAGLTREIWGTGADVPTADAEGS